MNICSIIIIYIIKEYPMYHKSTQKGGFFKFISCYFVMYLPASDTFESLMTFTKIEKILHLIFFHGKIVLRLSKKIILFKLIHSLFSFFSFFNANFPPPDLISIFS